MTTKPSWLQPGNSAIERARQDCESAIHRYSDKLFELATAVEAAAAIKLQAGGPTHAANLAMTDLTILSAETNAAFARVQQTKAVLLTLVQQRRA